LYRDNAAADWAEEDAELESLDPGDWDELRRLGHRMVDDALGYLRTVRDRAVWQSPPEDVRARLREPLPRKGQGVERAYSDFKKNVMPYPTGMIHPRWWGWVAGGGTPSAALYDFLASAINSSPSVFDDAPTLVERQVIEWLKELMGFPVGASGILTSGGSMANVLGLTVARNVRAPFDVRAQGLAGGPRLTVYGSTETHNSVRKAVEALGLGSEGLRRVPVDEAYRVDVAALARAMAEDRAAGLVPVAVVGNAGTVNTGAIDDLDALADLCAREGLWLHVDGAFGALAALDPELRPRLRGLERADSLAFDLHKWGYLPFEVACVLVRRDEDHRAAFAVPADYLAKAPRGLTARTRPFSDYGLQLTRGFRALKVWMSLKEHGTDRFARIIRRNVEQAAYLAARVRAEADLELLAPVPLNVVCFRWRGGGGAPLDDVNREILARLHESGVAVPSSTLLGGRFALRAAITNQRTRREDLDLLLAEVKRLGPIVAGGRE
jgi:glutamate/tyrosine decarboxylase-like PLP-dependent enzyme